VCLMVILSVARPNNHRERHNMRKDDTKARWTARRAFYIANKSMWMDADMCGCPPENFPTMIRDLRAADLLPKNVSYQQLTLMVTKELLDLDQALI